MGVLGLCSSCSIGLPVLGLFVVVGVVVVGSLAASGMVRCTPVGSRWEASSCRRGLQLAVSCCTLRGVADRLGSAIVGG